MKRSYGYGIAGLLTALAVAAWMVAPSSGAAAGDQGHQQLRTALLSEVSWGDANGCVENVATNDFGALTPALGASTRGAFDAFPHADASVDGDGQHVWVGCVTSNSTVGVSAQGIHDMEDAQGDVLPLSEVAIGVTNRPGGEDPAGCAIAAGQAGVGGCTLPHDGATNRVLVQDLDPGTAELHWQYQLNVPASQPAGDYAGGTVVFTATATDAIPPTAPESTAPPTISDAGAPQHVLTVTDGSWKGMPTSFAYQWQTCDAQGDDCVDVVGATERAYTPSSGDVSRTFRARVTASNDEGSATATTAVTGVLIPPPPASTGLPVITPSAPHETVTATATDGSWSGSPTSFDRQWLRCDTTGGACAAIDGATGSSYTPSGADLGHTLRVRVTATGVGGSGTATSAATSIVAAAAPTAGTPRPEISGTAQQGELLSATRGTFGGGAVDTYSYQWRRCDAAGASCADIAGASGTTYALVAADVGATVRVQVTAANVFGSVTETSDASAVVAVAPPTASTPLPKMSGPVIQGKTLSASQGTFGGGAVDAYTYRWQRCDTDGNGCAAIAGATDATYLLTAADVGARMRVVVTATNASGSATATSNASVIVAVAVPTVGTPAPQISGSPTEGQTLSATRGTFGGGAVDTYSYQWQRCNAAGGSCTDIAGARAASYVVPGWIAGSTIRVAVTASNATGSATATSNQTAVATSRSAAYSSAILADGPRHYWPMDDEVGSQWAADKVAVGDDLQLRGSGATFGDNGAITSAIAFPGNTAAVLSGAPAPDTDGSLALEAWIKTSDASSTYHAVVLFAGASVGTFVVNGNLYGYNWATGTALDSGMYVADGQWHQIALVISGGVQHLYVDGRERASGPWAISTIYGNAVAVGNGNVTDNGQRFNGSIDEVSVYDTPLTAAQIRSHFTTGSGAPFSSTAPSISGSKYVGRTLTADPGTWVNDPTSYGYQWQRCDAGHCANIAGADQATYTSIAAQAGSTLRVLVTATNARGSATATSDETATIVGAPQNLVLPTIDYGPAQGVELTTSDGSWSGEPSSFDYQWLLCDAVGSSCLPIVGATDDAFTPTASEVGRTLKVTVTATNPVGSTSVTSAASVPVSPPAPVSVDAPVLSTTSPAQGTALSTGDGTWTNNPASFAYRWQRCDAAGANCVAISGATSASYTPVAADAGKTLRAEVTATNNGGSTSRASSASGVVTTVPPVNTVAPSISGAHVEGSPMTASTGTWTGGTPTYTYQWQRCDINGANCVNSVTTSTYTPTILDNQRRVLVKVTATTAGGSATATSAVSPIITAKLYQDVVVADGPAAFWSLDDTNTTTGQKAADRMGTANNAFFVTPSCVVTQPALTTPLITNAGTDKAMTFKSVASTCAQGAYVLMPTTLMPTTSAFTLEVWMKGAFPASDGFHGQATGGVSNFALTGSRFAFRTASGTMQTMNLTTPVAANTTSHVVGIWNGTTMTVYVNGTLRQTSTPGVQPSFSTSVYSSLGVDTAGGATTDTLDEAAIYNKALTSAQVAQHYQHGIAAR